jgi:hypothetical protein
MWLVTDCNHVICCVTLPRTSTHRCYLFRTKSDLSLVQPDAPNKRELVAATLAIYRRFIAACMCQHGLNPTPRHEGAQSCDATPHHTPLHPLTMRQPHPTIPLKHKVHLHSTLIKNSLFMSQRKDTESVLQKPTDNAYLF